MGYTTGYTTLNLIPNNPFPHEGSAIRFDFSDRFVRMIRGRLICLFPSLMEFVFNF